MFTVTYYTKREPMARRIFNDSFETLDTWRAERQAKKAMEQFKKTNKKKTKQNETKRNHDKSSDRIN